MLNAPSALSVRILSTAELRQRGMRQHDLTDAVRGGRLHRVRRGRYLPLGTPDPLVEAARLGGRLDCVSLLAVLGVFVHESPALHIQVAPDASRMPTCPSGVTRHWRPGDLGAAACTDIVSALAQAVRCQPARAAIATLDSAWYLGLVDEESIAAVFALLPQRLQSLRRLLDPRAESGIETLVRLFLRALGYRPELQVRIRGVGRVDLVVDGWLIVECDSRQFHGEWVDHKKDRRRDAAAIALGYTPMRLLAEDVLFHPDRVIAWLRAALAGGPRTS